MIHTDILPHQQRINDAQKKGRELVYGFFIGIVVVLFLIWIGSNFFQADKQVDYKLNIVTEIISVFATIFIIDRINQWRDDRRLKNNLLEELRSSSVSPAVNALDRLRREKWLDEDYLVGKGLQRANWEGAYIGGLNFEKADMRSINLKNATNHDGQDNKPIIFKNAKLIEAHLEGANLYMAHLEGANLRGAHLEGANLWRAHLEGANLWVAHLEGAYLGRAHLEGAYLREAHLKGANLIEAHLEGAYLGRAHLEGAYLREANLKGANLREAHLEGANLYMAHLEGADLEGAYLEGADLSGAYLEGANLREANLKGADLRGAYLDNASWGDRRGRHVATLPDGTVWTEAERESLGCFTNPKHDAYKETLKAINAIRVKLGYDPLE